MEEEQLIKVCEVKDFLPGRKRLIELGNKDISIFRLENGEFYVNLFLFFHTRRWIISVIMLEVH
jgi:hypothetical protein